MFRRVKNKRWLAFRKISTYLHLEKLNKSALKENKSAMMFLGASLSASLLLMERLLDLHRDPCSRSLSASASLRASS